MEATKLTTQPKPEATKYQEPNYNRSFSSAFTLRMHNSVNSYVNIYSNFSPSYASIKSYKAT